ncbi:MAG: hypothetical protein JXJ04_12170, partial [Spirochaetales bacterium]|nr:hypothetical protein [Spirochaetales bacterium]
MRKKIVIIMLLCILFPLYPENINNDFELSLKLDRDTHAVLISIKPKRDIQIKGMSEEEPFIVLSGTGVIFENDGIHIRTDYITDSKPEILQFPFRLADDTREITSLEVHLEMTYVPCLISTGVCKFPQTIKHDYLLKPSSPGISLDIINTGILIGLFILGL